MPLTIEEYEVKPNYMMISLNLLAADIHRINVEKGFWEGGVASRNFGEALALVHSEITEAVEAFYAKAMDDKLSDLPGDTVEVADALIRVLDLGGAYGVDFSHTIYVEQPIRTIHDESDLESFLNVHSMISKVLEDHRVNADVTRLHDLAMLLLSLLYDLGGSLTTVLRKVNYNASRPYKHGKKY